jgi:hypothetical protein
MPEETKLGENTATMSCIAAKERTDGLTGSNALGFNFSIWIRLGRRSGSGDPGIHSFA